MLLIRDCKRLGKYGNIQTIYNNLSWHTENMETLTKQPIISDINMEIFTKQSIICYTHNCKASSCAQGKVGHFLNVI